jgi:tRNA (cmo5U34)-methyltransferase
VLTLQFVSPDARLALLTRIRDGLLSGSALILIEKIVIDDRALNDCFVELYLAFKRRNGYSESEIARKRAALEQVLVPGRPDENLALLQAAGFTRTAEFFRWYNFAGWIACK